jgi:hypothetical protein
MICKVLKSFAKGDLAGYEGEVKNFPNESASELIEKGFLAQASKEEKAEAPAAGTPEGGKKKGGKK